MSRGDDECLPYPPSSALMLTLHRLLRSYVFLDQVSPQSSLFLPSPEDRPLTSPLRARSLPCCAAAIAVIAYFLPLKAVKGSAKEKLKKIDYGGAVLTVAATVLLILPLNWGGTSFPWVSGPVLGCLVASFFAFAVFFLWEWKAARIPIVPRAYRSLRFLALEVTDAAALQPSSSRTKPSPPSSPRHFCPARRFSANSTTSRSTSRWFAATRRHVLASSSSRSSSRPQSSSSSPASSSRGRASTSPRSS